MQRDPGLVGQQGDRGGVAVAEVGDVMGPEDDQHAGDRIGPVNRMRR